MDAGVNEKATDRISVKPTTRRRFADFCGKGRSYDEALNTLLDDWEIYQKQQEE